MRENVGLGTAKGAERIGKVAEEEPHTVVNMASRIFNGFSGMARHTRSAPVNNMNCLRSEAAEAAANIHEQPSMFASIMEEEDSTPTTSSEANTRPSHPPPLSSPSLSTIQGLGGGGGMLGQRLVDTNEAPAGSAGTQPNRAYSSWDVFVRDKVLNKDKLKKEMSVGYFDDIQQIKAGEGKIFPATKGLLSKASATTFPPLPCKTAKNKSVMLPDAISGKVAALVCVGFRESAQPMIDSWAKPFVEKFAGNLALEVYEISIVDSWFFNLPGVKDLMLPRMREADAVDVAVYAPRVHLVYAFSGSPVLKQSLEVTNRLTAYMYLLDGEGRIRWKASGSATDEEKERLLDATNSLLRRARGVEEEK